MNPEKKTKSPLLLVFLTIFIDMLGFGILIPVIPQLLANPFSQYFLLPKDYTLDQGFIILGFLTAIFPLMQFIATPILGQLSDKYGRKPVLAISLAGTCISYVLFAFGIIWKNLPFLFFARGLDGITGGNISIAQAAIADSTSPENRAKSFGMVGAAFGLGFILGPYIGGKLSDPSIISWFDATTPFWFAAILSGLNTLSVFFFFPETNKFIDKVKKIEWSKSLHNIVAAAASPSLRVLFSTNFILTTGFTFFTTFVSVFFINRFGWTQGNIGDFFAYVGLWSAITQILITRPVIGKFGEKNVLKVTIFGMTLGLASYFLPTEGWQMLIITPFFSICNGLTMASMLSLVSRSSEGKVQGEVLGISTSVQALAQAIPAALSGFIAASLSADAPLYVATVSMFIAAMVYLVFYKPSQYSEPNEASVMTSGH